ncbi:DUF4238 domain-containing protein [Pseudomonas cichorii]|uniref:DUF4238 domain-containing protein n=1 Tax=Pseudomonas cichorii TaxID=36746 RepID=UPI001C87C3D3|nr:DUF4238 domain-containing protein [Pseudomonas cichorii]MBX8529134.1 DUF4238 domain-containing protein [Pseudomonas cichorii]MBX8543283.1 DUF4238 domain-containing protein [Pseudomonas cichorii]
MKKQPPRNHHFVPQHFLKAWQSSEGRIIRYREIPSTGVFEVKEVAIKHTASVDDLYRIDFPDGGFEIESTIVTPLIDESGYKILEKARAERIALWDKSDRQKLANYLTCLEARHPEILETMNIKDDLEKLRSQMKATKAGTHKAIDDVIDYFKKTKSLGGYIFGLLAQNEIQPLFQQAFSDGLLASEMQEHECNMGDLICTDYPTSRWGHYLSKPLFVIAISPNKALIYSSSPIGFGELTQPIRTQLINLYSLAKAKTAYFSDSSKSDFISKHLGWSKKLKTLDEQKRYIIDFLTPLLQAAEYRK